MVIYVGLDNNDNVIHEIYLFYVEKKIWNEYNLEGMPIQNKVSQSCCKSNIMYLFGYQGLDDDENSNGLFSESFKDIKYFKNVKSIEKPKL